MGRKIKARHALEQCLSQHDELFLIFGGSTGWIGGLLGELLEKNGRMYRNAESRMEDRESVIEEIRRVKPTRIINAAGVTGRPNVDWCEDHKIETIRSNVIGTLNLSDICEQLGIHCTVFATGCIFKYDKNHPMGSGVGFTEEEEANFTGSFYSLTKGMVETLLRCYKKSLVLRVRMPISDELVARNFITKITKYEHVVNIPNSMTVLGELLPVSIIMSERELTGVYNFTNPGVISHNEVLELYKEYVDAGFRYKNFTEEEQNKMLKAKRSNNELDCDKLIDALPDIQISHIRDALETVMRKL